MRKSPNFCLCNPNPLAALGNTPMKSNRQMRTLLDLYFFILLRFGKSKRLDCGFSVTVYSMPESIKVSSLLRISPLLHPDVRAKYWLRLRFFHLVEHHIRRMQEIPAPASSGATSKQIPCEIVTTGSAFEHTCSIRLSRIRPADCPPWKNLVLRLVLVNNDKLIPAIPRTEGIVALHFPQLIRNRH